MKIDKEKVLTIITSYLGDGIDGQTLVSMTKFINALPTDSEWVSVGDRLPELGEKVLICRYYDNILMGKLMLTSAENNIWMAFFKDKFDEADGVTHWQPLPSAPTK